MKKLWIAFVLLAGLGRVALADTTTTRLGLVKPSIGSTGWGTKWNNNLDILDPLVAVLNRTNIFTSTPTFPAIYFVDGSTMTTAAKSSTGTVINYGNSFGGVFKIGSYDNFDTYIGRYLGYGGTDYGYKLAHTANRSVIGNTTFSPNFYGPTLTVFEVSNTELNIRNNNEASSVNLGLTVYGGAGNSGSIGYYGYNYDAPPNIVVPFHAPSLLISGSGNGGIGIATAGNIRLYTDNSSAERLSADSGGVHVSTLCISGTCKAAWPAATAFGSPITGGVAQAVPFIDANGNLAQQPGLLNYTTSYLTNDFPQLVVGTTPITGLLSALTVKASPLGGIISSFVTGNFDPAVFSGGYLNISGSNGLIGFSGAYYDGVSGAALKGLIFSTSAAITQGPLSVQGGGSLDDPLADLEILNNNNPDPKLVLHDTGGSGGSPDTMNISFQDGGPGPALFEELMNLGYTDASHAVLGDSDGLVISTGPAVLGTPTGELFRFTRAGNIGIGTNSPSTKLHLSSGVFTIDGSPSSIVITSTGTGNPIAITSNGVPSGGLQNRTGGALNITQLGVGDALVIVSSFTSAQLGSSVIAIHDVNLQRNDPIIRVFKAAQNSAPEMRWDSPSPNMEMVNTSTDNAHGLGKWEPFASPNLGTQLQINSRDFDNGSFERVAEWLPRSQGVALKLYPTVLGDAGNPTATTTGKLLFYTTDTTREIGIRGPMSATASWYWTLPSTFNNASQVMYQSTDGPDRNLAFTTGGTTGQVLQYNSGSAPTWATASGSMAIGGAVTGASAGPVFYGGTSGTLAQNTSFYFDADNHVAVVGATTPFSASFLDYKLHVYGGMALKSDPLNIGGADLAILDGASLGGGIYYDDALKYTELYAVQTGGLRLTSYGDWSFRNNAGTTYMTIKSDGKVGIGTSTPATKLHISSGIFTTDGTTAYHTFAMNTTTPTAVTEQTSIWAVNDGGSAEMKVLDGAGNVTTISPHDPMTGDWIFYSENVRTGKRVYVNMEKFIHRMEEISGEKFIFDSPE